MVLPWLNYCVFFKRLRRSSIVKQVKLEQDTFNFNSFRQPKLQHSAVRKYIKLDLWTVTLFDTYGKGNTIQQSNCFSSWMQCSLALNSLDSLWYCILWNAYSCFGFLRYSTPAKPMHEYIHNRWHSIDSWKHNQTCLFIAFQWVHSCLYFKAQVPGMGSQTLAFASSLIHCNS